jgi:hypothetical protein
MLLAKCKRPTEDAIALDSITIASAVIERSQHTGESAVRADPQKMHCASQKR